MAKIIVISTPLTRTMQLRDFRAMNLAGFSSKHIWSRDRKRIIGTEMSLLPTNSPHPHRQGGSHGAY